MDRMTAPRPRSPSGDWPHGPPGVTPCPSFEPRPRSSPSTGATRRTRGHPRCRSPSSASGSGGSPSTCGAIPGTTPRGAGCSRWSAAAATSSTTWLGPMSSATARSLPSSGCADSARRLRPAVTAGQDQRPSPAAQRHWADRVHPTQRRPAKPRLSPSARPHQLRPRPPARATEPGGETLGTGPRPQGDRGTREGCANPAAPASSLHRLTSGVPPDATGPHPENS